MECNSFMFSSNKDHVEEMKRANDEKLAGLKAKLEDCESTLKSHRRELNVSTDFQSSPKKYVKPIFVH